VAHEQERPLPAVALEAGDEIAASWFEREDLRRDTLAIEEALQIFGAAGLVARRIAGVHLDESREDSGRFFARGFEVGLGHRGVDGIADDRDSRDPSERGPTRPAPRCG
jgi:hypothetical protein